MRCLQVLLTLLSYLSIIAGSVGMLLFPFKYGFSTRAQELKYCGEWQGIRADYFWLGSWGLIIGGTCLQLVTYAIGAFGNFTRP